MLLSAPSFGSLCAGGPFPTAVAELTWPLRPPLLQADADPNFHRGLPPLTSGGPRLSRRGCGRQHRQVQARQGL